VKAFDVVILGGGPAGCATALALKRHAPALSILILEATRLDKPRIGEVLAPTARPLLDQLGVGAAFRRLDSLRSAGLISTWGLCAGIAVDDALSRATGSGVFLDRGAFDRMLVEAAIAAGIEVRLGIRFADFERVEGHWRLGQGLEPARFLVDATGRAAVFARRIGIGRHHFDDQVGLYCFFEDSSADQRLLIEPVESGWFYSALLPDGRRAVALFTHRDLARERHLRDPQIWLEQTGMTRVLKTWLEGARPVSGISSHSASTCRLETAVGEDWLAVGDAALALDPLAGQGLVKALAHGFWAAYAAADLLAGRIEAKAKYQQVVASEVEPFLKEQRELYDREKRWAAAPFWRQRGQRPLPGGRR
jgi:flavin-dependent dehydrogenase